MHHAVHKLMKFLGIAAMSLTNVKKPKVYELNFLRFHCFAEKLEFLKIRWNFVFVFQRIWIENVFVKIDEIF